MDEIRAQADTGNLVVMAGAGISSGPPTSLPSWKPLNVAILRALAGRLERALDRPGRFMKVVERAQHELETGAFPPEYQAQIIEEMCGERYFHALQALDVDVPNPAHESLAELAARGAIRAIVTTNFDRLIERSLESRGVAVVTAFDERGYEEASRRLARPLEADQPVVVLKLHGCVSSPGSMVDTLKQRKLGRSEKLDRTLAHLSDAYWVYVGFSAADLEGDPEYLGLRRMAGQSPGALYVSWPGRPPQADKPLSPGAENLLSAYGTSGRRTTAEIDAALLDIVGKSPTARGDVNPRGPALLEAGLDRWADELSVAATGLCLGAVMEAVGQAELGVRVLDRLIRHELLGPDDREGDDYRLLQYHYGRMGAALGRFVGTVDINGSPSNASVEAPQSLLRILRTSKEHDALNVLPTAWLWLGEGRKAIEYAKRAFATAVDLTRSGWPPPAETGEQRADAWINATQVAYCIRHGDMLSVVGDSANAAAEAARACGDPVRAGRIGALLMLCAASSPVDIHAIGEPFGDDFAQADRVGDGFGQAFRKAAIARWQLSPRAQADVPVERRLELSEQASTLLPEAAELFGRQGMHPWVLYCHIQLTKALADLGEWDRVHRTIEECQNEVDRYPIWGVEFFETLGQLHLMNGDKEDAEPCFRNALKVSRARGLGDINDARFQRYFEIIAAG